MGYITVAELIELLKQYDQKAFVFISDPEGGPYELQEDMISQQEYIDDEYQHQKVVYLGIN